MIQEGDTTGALLTAAREVAAKAYAPHSGFGVGTAIRTVAGNLFTGCNVENASYGLTICAERNAVAAAVAAEGAGMRVASVVVYVDADRAFAPCGACRQVLAEFSDADTKVFFVGKDPNSAKSMTVGELLPEAFSL